MQLECNKTKNLNIMKKIYTTIVALFMPLMMMAQAQGWPADYGGVMLQGFYWDGFDASKWTSLTRQADEIANSFDLVWLPQSANCGGTSMGYDDLYWFTNYNSSFGSESELRTLITTLKNKGVGCIADVVINHRKNKSNWVDFPSETYNGVTYSMGSTDICNNDDGGATKTWATTNGYSLSSNNDTGEDWGGMRDLDHKSTNVQNVVKAYLKMLLNDLGYVGFRYDMVKGYSGSFTKTYNNDSNPTYSVGECWDGTNTIKNWIDATNKTSAAFDFQFRYTVRNAINRNDWTYLGKQNDGNWPLISNSTNSGAYKRYAVTFVENHDTERRPGAEQDPIKKDTLAANAYLLAMPGTPCVFYTHWLDCKDQIKPMIAARKAVGINNLSATLNFATNTNYYAVRSTGTNGQLMCVVGPGASTYTPNGAWTKVLSGYKYAYYFSNSMETAWADLASGKYEGAQTVTLTAVSATSGAKLVYTTNGSNPTTSSTQVASGGKITIPTGNTTLKVGVLANGSVSGIITRQYEIIDFEPYNIDVFVNTDQVGWTAVNFWTWGGDGSHGPTNTSWPGDKVTTTVSVNGMNWYKKSFTINSSDDYVNFVFSTGTGSPQTVNVENINQTSYLVVSSEKSGSNHLVTDVTTGIDNVIMGQPDRTSAVYSIDGRLVRTNGQIEGLQKGIYIMNGKKFIVK